MCVLVSTESFKGFMETVKGGFGTRIFVISNRGSILMLFLLKTRLIETLVYTIRRTILRIDYSFSIMVIRTYPLPVPSLGGHLVSGYHGDRDGGWGASTVPLQTY